jgi:hypothetical protein
MMIRPNQVLSQFRDGLDTCSIAVHFGITEAQAYELLDEARNKKFQISFDKNAYRRGAIKGARAAAISKRKVSVSLAPLKFLEVK